jgi:hypothetical protein
MSIWRWLSIRLVSWLPFIVLFAAFLVGAYHVLTR